jgi:DNA processing protein
MARDAHAVPEAILRLLLCEGAGPRFAHDAVAALGSPEAVVAAPAAALAQALGIAPARAAAVRTALDAVDTRAERGRMAAAGVRFVARGDADEPRLLARIPYPPLGLWVRGDAAVASREAVAIVGARRASAYGLAQAGRFAAALAGEGIVIVSGGARGVDAQAHRAALRVGGRTVAVLGCGLGEPYPPEHVELFESIVAAGGALVSEFPTLYPPLAANFPRRNRIISGLCAGVLVVEAGRTSGALITARYAADDHGREVCALPGPVDSPRSEGCNAAIRDGWAHLVAQPAELLEIVRGAGVRDGARALFAQDEDELEAVGVPAALRGPVARAAELLSRRPRMPAAELGRALGLEVGTATAARTFATLLLQRARGDGQVQPMA